MTLLLVAALVRARRLGALRFVLPILVGLVAVSCPRGGLVAGAAASADPARAERAAVDDGASAVDSDTETAASDPSETDGGADGEEEVAFGTPLPLAVEPMAPFFEALAAMEDRRAGVVRVLHYGDSHTAADLLTTAIRRSLQDRFGDGGRGFVHLGKPWKSYRPKDAALSLSPSDWRSERILVAADPSTLDGRYGLAGVCSMASRRGAWARLATAPSGAYGRTAASFDVFYMIQRGGGSFDVRVDGRVVGTVSTNGRGPRSGFFRARVAAGAHELEVRLRGDGEVRLFGAAIEGPGPGIAYDGLGVNGAFFYTPLRWDAELLAEQIARRDPSLIVAMYGSNEVDSRSITEESYRADVRRVMERFLAGAPEASCLLLGPPDRVPRDPVAGRARLDWIIEAQREVADELGCGFIDVRELLGGAGSNAALQRLGMAQPDGVHLTARGYRILGDRLADEMIDAYDRFRAGENPGR